MRYIHRSQRIFSETSFTFWTDDISFISVGLNAMESIPSQFPQRKCYWTVPGIRSETLWDEFTHHQEGFKERFFLVSIWGYFLYHRKRHCAKKYPIADFKKTVLANWSLKRTVSLCELPSYIEVHFHWRLLSSFYLNLFPFSPWPQWAPKYHFAESTTTVLANCSKKERVELCVTE